MSADRDAVHDAAHELRTPLARLRGDLAALAYRAGGSPLHRDIAAALSQTEAMLDLLSSMLRLAEIEHGDRRARFERIDLSRLAADLAAAYAPAIADQGRDFAVDAGGGIAIDGDRRLIEQMLANLLDNGMTHSPPGSAMSLSVTQAEDIVTIVVTDRGGGIAGHDRAAAMRKFHRLAPTEVDGHAATTGHGLGLPLVAAIARMHGGAVTLADAQPGLRVVVTIPDARPPGSRNPA